MRKLELIAFGAIVAGFLPLAASAATGNPAIDSSRGTGMWRNLPCLSGVCLGDDLANALMAHEWESPPFVDESSGYGEPAAKELARTYARSAIKGVPSARFDEVAIRTIQHKADASLMRILSGPDIKLCRNVHYAAAFRSESNYLTVAEFSVTNDKKLRVTQLWRLYPRTEDSVQQAALWKQLTSVFPFLSGEQWDRRVYSPLLDRYSSPKPEAWQGFASLQPTNFKDKYELRFWLDGDSINAPDKVLAGQPGCSESAPSLD